MSGQSFAMLSGTSMATPHIAGVAALVKQKHPDWDVSSIRSAILTTASQRDTRSRLLRADQPSINSSTTLGQGTFFDYGFGAVNATAALDPGLVFKTGTVNVVLTGKCTRPLSLLHPFKGQSIHLAWHPFVFRTFDILFLLKAQF